MSRIFVPRDAAAIALGADGVAKALAAAVSVPIVRTGSRGMFWLEPMIEVETPAGRIAYGPVQAADVESLLASGLLTGGAHALRLGRPEEIPFLAAQTRLTFGRCGVTDPLSVDEYRQHGGLKGLARAIEIGAGGHDRRGDAVRIARARRRRVSDRDQVADRGGSAG